MADKLHVRMLYFWVTLAGIFFSSHMYVLPLRDFPWQDDKTKSKEGSFYFDSFSISWMKLLNCYEKSNLMCIFGSDA